MQQTSSAVVKNDVSVVTATPGLRELFAYTHSKMSGRNPSAKQFPPEEQLEMRLVCIVTVRGNKKVVDKVQTEANYLELINYLTEQGVSLLDITGRARSYGRRTQSRSMRLLFDEINRRKAAEAVRPQFLQPAMA